MSFVYMPSTTFCNWPITITTPQNVRDWLYTYQAFINKEHAAHEGFKS
jgi:hypothetical protein